VDWLCLLHRRAGAGYAALRSRQSQATLDTGRPGPGIVRGPFPLSLLPMLISVLGFYDKSSLRDVAKPAGTHSCSNRSWAQWLLSGRGTSGSMARSAGQRGISPLDIVGVVGVVALGCPPFCGPSRLWPRNARLPTADSRPYEASQVTPNPCLVRDT
jgi:hypothetical protein